MDFVLEAQHKLDNHHKQVLRKHAKNAHEAGGKPCRLTRGV